MLYLDFGGKIIATLQWGQYFQKLLLPNFPDFPDFRQLIAFSHCHLKPILSRWEATFCLKPLHIGLKFRERRGVSFRQLGHAGHKILASCVNAVANGFSSMASHLSSITSVFGLVFGQFADFFAAGGIQGLVLRLLFFFQLLNVIGKREPFLQKLQFFGHVRPFFPL